MSQNKFEVKLVTEKMMGFLPNPRQIIIQIIEKKIKEIMAVVKDLTDVSIEGMNDTDKKEAIYVSLEMNKEYLRRLQEAHKIAREMQMQG